MIIKTGFVPNIRLGNVFRSPRPNLKARACARFFPPSFCLIAVAGQNPSIKECKKSHNLWLKSPTTYDVARCARDRGRKMLRGTRPSHAAYSSRRLMTDSVPCDKDVARRYGINAYDTRRLDVKFAKTRERPFMQ